MKQYSSLIAANIFLLFIILSSCQKETKELTTEETLTTALQSMGPLEPGFAENDMVMYWNDKAAVILSEHTNPGSDSRLFAIIEIAVYDALNCIVPKYQRYALLNEREQFANANAAVASAAYWAIKGLNIQKTFPIDTWYSECLA